MGGYNLEVFKFAVYVFFPVAFMYYVGVPEFYDRHVKGSSLVRPNDPSQKTALSVTEAREMMDKYLQQIKERK